LSLNGIAVASGDLLTAIASIAATSAAYAYRIRVEDAMLIARFGNSYQSYHREVRAVIPSGLRVSAAGERK
jgi:protein-S-isoprenylcysteine O-methyltransferase Ste14